jgi:adenylate cyclase
MTPLQKKSLARFINSFVVLFALILLWENTGFLSDISKKLEQSTLDFRYQNFAPTIFPSNEIVFIDIDELSLKKVSTSEGQWPWKRDVWSNAIRTLSLGEPKAILFDILLTEEDKANPQADTLLAQVANEFPSVSFAMSFESTGVNPGIRFPATEKKLGIDIDSPPIAAGAFQTLSKPFSPLWENLSHVHVVNSFKDNDGRFRKTPIYLNYDYQAFPSLPLKALQIYFNEPKMALTKGKLLLFTEEKGVTIPLEEDARLSYHFYQSDFQTFSFGSLYELPERLKSKAVDSGRLADLLQTHFKNKILIIGSSAPSLKDLKETPLSTQYPGALLHATAVSNVLEKHFLRKPFSDWQMVLALLLVISIYLNFIFNKTIPWKNGLPPVLLAGYGFLSLYLFHVEQIDLPLSTPLIFGLICYLDTLIYFFESRMVSHSEK